MNSMAATLIIYHGVSGVGWSGCGVGVAWASGGRGIIDVYIDTNKITEAGRTEPTPVGTIPSSFLCYANSHRRTILMIWPSYNLGIPYIALECQIPRLTQVGYLWHNIYNGD